MSTVATLLQLRILHNAYLVLHTADAYLHAEGFRHCHQSHRGVGGKVPAAAQHTETHRRKHRRGSIQRGTGSAEVVTRQSGMPVRQRLSGRGGRGISQHKGFPRHRKYCPFSCIDRCGARAAGWVQTTLITTIQTTQKTARGLRHRLVMHRESRTTKSHQPIVNIHKSWSALVTITISYKK